MKNPFMSPKANNAILILCYALGVYIASREENISFWGILFLGAIAGFLIYLLLKWACLMKMEYDRRVENGIDLDAVLETDPEKVKSRMWVVMQYGHHEGIEGALKEFNDIFRNYPQWELKNWDMFRAWYKNLIDGCLTYPEIYSLTNSHDGSPYVKELDPLYDPSAQDWEQFAVPDKYDDEDESAGIMCQTQAEERPGKFARAFGFGMGVGIVNGLFGGNGS